MERSREIENVIYTALFVDDVAKLKEKYPPVHPNIYYHHSTIAFRPRNGKKGINVGTRHVILITGRVKTGLVDVLLVQNEESENEYPHITLSTADGVNPSASNNEIAKAISRGTVIPVQDCLRVTEGYFNGKTDVKK